MFYFTDDTAVYRYTFAYDLLEELYSAADLPDAETDPGKTRVLLDSNGKIIVVSKTTVSTLE